MFDWNSHAPADAEGTAWDVVVVGTGMGGSTIGYALASKGLKVLFIERGCPASGYAEALRGGRLKRWFGLEREEARLAAMGRWPFRVTRVRGGQAYDFIIPLGNGPGGSSAIYGAALERMRRTDFEDHKAPQWNPSPLRNDWPIDFDEFSKYYRKAEAMFSVAGTRDPGDPDDDSNLAVPSNLSNRDQYFFETFESAGMNPYRLHVGIAYRAGCGECLGVLCPRNCKSDAANRALQPALRDHQAKLLLNCSVEKIEATETRAMAVIARSGDARVKLRGSVIILAAGALSTPLILLNSRSTLWPTGIGNHHDLVGRGLMFHCSDLFALWAPKGLSAEGPRKTLSSRALYQIDGQKFGSFQSLGLPVSYGQVASFLNNLVERRVAIRIPFVRSCLRLLAVLASMYFSRASLFATIVEDFPYRTNRVVPDASRSSGFSIEYEKSSELSNRIEIMRNVLLRALARLRPSLLTDDDNLNMGHPSGTCRFGHDPATSVLMSSNRVHGMENLYVVDASFFPSSSGANPSLTVAANALRVADLISDSL